MARKRYSDEDVLRILREIEVLLSSGKYVPDGRGLRCDVLQMAQKV